MKQINLPLEGQVYRSLARTWPGALRAPRADGPPAAAGELGGLADAEPEPQRLDGELPGLLGVHSDSNPDTRGCPTFCPHPPPRPRRVRSRSVLRALHPSTALGTTPSFRGCAASPAGALPPSAAESYSTLLALHSSAPVCPRRQDPSAVSGRLRIRSNLPNP